MLTRRHGLKTLSKADGLQLGLALRFFQSDVGNSEFRGIAEGGVGSGRGSRTYSRRSRKRPLIALVIVHPQLLC